MTAKSVTIKLVKSPAGRLKKQKACVAGLGLRRIGAEVVVEDIVPVRGLLNKTDHLIKEFYWDGHFIQIHWYA